MKKTVWGMAAGAAMGATCLGAPVTLNGATWAKSCRPMDSRPFEGLGASVAGIGLVAEGAGGQYLIPYLSFDQPTGYSGSYKALLWDGNTGWKPLTAGSFKATNGVLQFVNLHGKWHGFSNGAQRPGGPQIPLAVVSNGHGGFEEPRPIGAFSKWGEFDSAAKSLNEDRIGLTGRDRLGKGLTNVFAEKIGNHAWVSEPILLKGQATPEGFSTLISFDQGGAPWIAYESQPGGTLNEAGILTRTAQGWSLIPVSSRNPSNLVGAYLPPTSEHPSQRLALAWVEKRDTAYEVKSALLDLATRKLSGERTIASGLGRGISVFPLPAIAVAHDGKRATITLMSVETHQGWTSQLAGVAFSDLVEIPVPGGQNVIGFPQAFYSSCDDSAQMMIGIGPAPTPGLPFDLGVHLKIESVARR